MGNLADDQEEVIRIAGLLRGTESAAQTVSVSILLCGLTVLCLLTDIHFAVRSQQFVRHGIRWKYLPQFWSMGHCHRACLADCRTSGDDLRGQKD